MSRWIHPNARGCGINLRAVIFTDVNFKIYF